MTTIAFSIYLMIGFFLGLYCDHHQMKRDVPYGELPSGILLGWTRGMVMLIFVLIGPVVAVYMFWKTFKEHYLA